MHTAPPSPPIASNGLPLRCVFGFGASECLPSAMSECHVRVPCPSAIEWSLSAPNPPQAIGAPDAADPWESQIVEAAASEARLEGLDGGVAYTIRLASQNLLGWGPPSPPLALSTPAGATDPDPPQPPAHLAPPDGRCDAIMLRLPPSRRGCAHDDALTLQMRSPLSATWSFLQTVDVSVPTTAPLASASSPAEADLGGHTVIAIDCD